MIWKFIMNNNLGIIFAVECNLLLVYIQRVLLTACCPLNWYPEEPRHFSEWVWDSCIESAAGQGGSNALFSAPTCSPTYYNHSHCGSIAVTTDPSYSEGMPDCPPRVRVSLETDTSKFTLHLLSHTPGGFQWQIYILLIVTWSYSLMVTEFQ